MNLVMQSRNRGDPFFIIGSPRSGTTLLRLMLTSNTSFVVPPECGFVIWLHPVFGAWSLSEFSNPAEVACFTRDVVVSRKFETWELERQTIENAILEAKPETYGEACSCIYDQYSAQVGKPSATWGDKNNYYLSHITTLASIFPTARFLHIVRDGRDVACSYREAMTINSVSPYRPALPVEIDNIASKWAKDLEMVRKQLVAVDVNQRLELRYEDLVTDPRHSLSLVCNWLGHQFEPTMLDFHIANRMKRLEPAATMDWKQRTLEPVSSSGVGRHAIELTKSEESDFISVAGTELRYYRYL